MKKTVALIVLDGWGLGDQSPANPICAVQPKTIEFIKNNFPSGSLQASGITVGLPWGEEGNSEVGHLTLGIGAIIYQHYPRISIAIHDKSFFKNETINAAIEHVQKTGGTLHLVGLIGSGNIHSSLEHVSALLQLMQEKKINYAIHPITDGRDSGPESAFSFLSQLPQEKIGSVMGRFYAMDRDKHWNFTQQSYTALTGGGPSIALNELESHIKQAYAKNLNDEYVLPATINKGARAIKDGDAVFFFNFREDRMRQIAEAFTNPQFSYFPIRHFENLFVASMTQLHVDFNIPVAFPPQEIASSLGAVLANADKTQLRIAETQKYAHVTFFFNGLKDAAYKNEYRILLPSKTTSRQELDPEMMAPAITTRLLQAMEEHAFDFILANFANADMIAHTGNFEVAKKAITILDQQLEKIVQMALATDTTLIITADHGNIERMFNPLTGEIETKHDTSPVPVYLVGKEFQRPQFPHAVMERERFTIGMLADVAPTVLELLNIPKPNTMTGSSLLPQLHN